MDYTALAQQLSCRSLTRAIFLLHMSSRQVIAYEDYQSVTPLSFYSSDRVSLWLSATCENTHVMSFANVVKI